MNQKNNDIETKDMKEEDFLKEKGTKPNPFKVPDGYFEDFTAKLMESLPQEDKNETQKEKINLKVSLTTKIKPYLYLAALFGGLFFGLQVFKYQEANTNKQQVANSQNEMEKKANSSLQDTDTYVDEVCNYTMVDNYDLYTCMTTEE